MKSSLAQCLVLIIVGMSAPGASNAASADSLNLGLGGLNPMGHCNATVYLIEYEHPLTPTTAILGRGSGVNYRYNNGVYLEDGSLRGLDWPGFLDRAQKIDDILDVTQTLHGRLLSSGT